MSAGAASVGALHLGCGMAWAQYVGSPEAGSVSTLQLGRCYAWTQYVVSCLTGRHASKIARPLDLATDLHLQS